MAYTAKFIYLIPSSSFKGGLYDGEISRKRSLGKKESSLSTKKVVLCTKACRSFGSKRLILPRATFNFDSEAQPLTEFGRNIIGILQSGAAAASKMWPVSSSSQFHTEDMSEGFLSSLPSISFEVFIGLATTFLGMTAGYLAAALSIDTHWDTEKTQKDDYYADEDHTAGDWLLVMNSTPFNRFVLMRCSSIMFEDMDVYEGLSKKLSTEGHHVVKLRTGGSDKISVSDVDGVLTEEDKFSLFYQRTYLHAGDGGVLAIDWPSHLELSGEHGLDTTFLLVPGSVYGSGDKQIKNFVQKSLRCGYFPIILNPRGCGGSPLTTPRLFTAGDSDDVRTAVQFVLKSRPSTIIMAVGWGYGANMLIKYLGEEAATTPVTAAVCIENIFDLEELGKLNQGNIESSTDQEMANGFVLILKSNQVSMYRVTTISQFV